MILALATLGWGLFAAGAVSHTLHFGRLVELLSLHHRNPQWFARLLVGTELAIVGLTGLSLLAGVQSALVVSALCGALLGLAFTGWVLRLLLSGSTLPCACSFSAGPTTRWSVARAAGTMLVALLVLVPPTASQSEIITALVVGAAAGWAGFLLPDALSWPDESIRLRALVKASVSPDTTAANTTSTRGA